MNWKGTVFGIQVGVEVTLEKEQGLGNWEAGAKKLAKPMK